MLIFLKLGGSLLTDKTQVEQIRPAVLTRLASEIQAARQAQPDWQLVIGHGSGSFGHVAAARYGTRWGANTPEEWAGFAQVSDAAARLNSAARQALLAAGAPVVTLQPSASAVCHDGALVHLATAPVQAALQAGLVPLLYGDVAFDEVRGSAIISTEEVLGYLAVRLRPAWFLLAGETEGVLDETGQVIPLITPERLPAVQAVLKGSRGTDVTGGMASKVQQMVELAQQQPGLSIRIFSGLTAGALHHALRHPDTAPGTLIQAAP